jgi:isoamylase
MITPVHYTYDIVSLPPFDIDRGHSLPFGASVTTEGVNFSVFSRNAREVKGGVTLVLYDSNLRIVDEIELDPIKNKTGDVWHILVRNLDPSFSYCYRVKGPYFPHKGQRFIEDIALIDPYATALTGGYSWGKHEYTKSDISNHLKRAGRISPGEFDWENDKPLNIPLNESVYIIYELHVRGFTIDNSSKVAHPGTFKGLIEKIPYLKELGITAVELMPIAEFDENENPFRNPFTFEQLKNFWGYSSIAFIAPKASYASEKDNQVNEFKLLIKELHKAGIEVILDVVFNHTAEGSDKGPTINFKGFDNSIYYMLSPDKKEYMNYSGCGNTLNCNHPIVRNYIIDCLRYWVTENHIDGFRFDLASILGRDINGEVLSNPPLIERIAEDPILSKTKIIAEAWDAAGLYQVGEFAKYSQGGSRWAEWNGRFRDDVRQFIKGDSGYIGAMATRFVGSSDLYHTSGRKPYNSINFITSHDGLTLYDLVSYNYKHNEPNGEDNRDGCNANHSWNCGIEGETDNEEVKTLRARQIKNYATILLLSQGVPMLLAGDEFGRTQKGNNNAYCQDNQISWIDWTLKEKNHHLFRFFKMLIKLRRLHKIFWGINFLGLKDIKWFGLNLDRHNWESTAKCLSIFMDGTAAVTGRKKDDNFFIMLNSDSSPQRFSIPHPPSDKKWLRIIDTSFPSGNDIVSEDEADKVSSRHKYKVNSRTIVVLISKPESFLKIRTQALSKVKKSSKQGKWMKL